MDRKEWQGDGYVKAVPSGDTLVLMSKKSSVRGPPPEIRLTLSGIQAPKLGRTDKNEVRYSNLYEHFVLSGSVANFAFCKDRTLAGERTRAYIPATVAVVKGDCESVQSHESHPHPRMRAQTTERRLCVAQPGVFTKSNDR